MLLTKGNSKLGSVIYQFNLPAQKTCPGSSELCRQHCYVRRFKRFAGVADRFKDNHKASLRDDFVDQMIDEIQDSGVRLIRVHTSGDFYDVEYVKKWIEIVKACPQTVFYAYSRSWRIPKIFAALERLRRCSNFQLWWSCDKETGEPPEGRVAYMSCDDEDIPHESAALVFRVKRSTEMVKCHGIPVCPKESGRKYPGLTCATCRICFRDAC